MSVEHSAPTSRGSESSVECSPPRGAVFLSYASQDADAARRIAQALRAEGIEVWFDESALAGGEAWDASIRRQIRDCALFVAIVSANTQARKEGYFRLEWKLADERSQLIAEGTPFVLPVIIDGTKERDALVPKSFLGVQWTWLPHGEVPPVFVTRVQRLLGVGSAAVGTSTSAQVASASEISPTSTPTIEPETRAARRPRFHFRWTVVLPWALCVGLGVAWLIRQPKRADTSDPRYYELALPESAPVAFTGPAPNGAWQRAVAISRDGRTVAYIALKGGTTSLVARFLDTGGTREYPGTEGAFLPFFSPDGQWIGFFVMGELKKVAIGGGTPSTLATDIHVAAGAVWTTPDRILVARGEGGRPMWVSLSSRAITPVANPAFPKNMQTRAADLDVLPGEEWAIGSWHGFLKLLSLKGTGVHWLSKDGPVRAEIAKMDEVVRGWSPRYLKEGYLVFQSGQGTELQAMRFDPARVRPTGAPFTVLEGIRREVSYSSGQFAVSDQGVLIYAPGADSTSSELCWIDSQGQREKVATPTGSIHDLNLSRDGLAAFFCTKPVGRYGDLIVVDAATGRQVRSLPYDRASARPLWGPDGSLYVTPTDVFMGSSGQRTLRFASVATSVSAKHPADFDQPTAVSPDGSWMAFTIAGANSTLRSVSDPKAPAVSIHPAGWCASFSPDSRWLAFTVFGPVNKTVVIPVPYDGRRFEVAADEGRMPRWFPDGRRLAYLRGRQIMVVDLAFQGDRVDASPPRVFVEGPFLWARGWVYDIGLDGRVLTSVNAEETSARQLNIITNFPELVRQKERQAAR